MADQLQTERRHTDNSRECFCSSTNQLSTLDFSTTQRRASCIETRSMILDIRQGIRRRRAPIEESQDRENCVRRPMFYRPADKFSTDAACAYAPAHRPMRNLAQCCNRL